MASGLLVLCFGEATKFAGELLDGRKRYLAEVTLGTKTSTGDREGDVVASRPVAVDDESIAGALESFRGDISQVPPMYSALKRNGRPLYEYARQGETLDRAPRRVHIYDLRLIGGDGQRLNLDVICSKGTYIRSLAEDLGEALGCGAHLSALVRTSLGAFQLSDASTIEELTFMQSADRDMRLLPIDSLLTAYPSVHLEESLARRFLLGQTVLAEQHATCAVRVYGPSHFLGTGSLEGSELRPKRLLSQALTAGRPDRSKEIILEKRGISG